jgi:hypothetical protein
MKLTILYSTLVCATLAVAEDGGAQQKLEKLHVGVAGLSGALAHAFIPKDTGLYEKFGMDVDLVFFQGGPAIGVDAAHPRGRMQLTGLASCQTARRETVKALTPSKADHGRASAHDPEAAMVH